MKNIGMRAKRNPWRNTRNDYNMPWNDIFAAIFMAILPLIVVIFASNIIIRGTFFYSFYFTRTDVVKEIPYEIKKDQLIENFGKYMQHRKSDFQIKENSKYKPQNVFTDRGISIMQNIRTIFDVSLAIGISLAVVALVIVIYLYRQKEKRLIYESFTNSVIWFSVICAIYGGALLITPIRKLIFRILYGVRFEPGDVLIQIFKTHLPSYYAIMTLILAVMMMIVIWYLMNKFVSYQKMFNKGL